MGARRVMRFEEGGKVSEHLDWEIRHDDGTTQIARTADLIRDLYDRRITTQTSIRPVGTDEWGTVSRFAALGTAMAHTGSTDVDVMWLCLRCESRQTVVDPLTRRLLILTGWTLAAVVSLLLGGAGTQDADVALNSGIAWLAFTAFAAGFPVIWWLARPRCQQCGCDELIPARSPRAQRIVGATPSVSDEPPIATD